MEEVLKIEQKVHVTLKLFSLLELKILDPDLLIEVADQLAVAYAEIEFPKRQSEMPVEKPVQAEDDCAETADSY